MEIKKREFWLNLIEKTWPKRSILWLSGVRRVGKTYLCLSISNTIYFDCELPRVRREIEDPETFFKRLKGKRLVLDEIHRLKNPSEVLKIAADHFPDIKIIATGSSTLQTMSRFKDTLAGRKYDIWLTPMISQDTENFGNADIFHRLKFGGLPPFFMQTEFPERDFQEWLDAFWAKDIQDLFRLEKRYSFLKFIELLLAQSGGIFEATRFASACEVSRLTVNNYLSILEATHLVTIVRPFSTRKRTEIISAPKVYGFDTGFICYFKGWKEIRNEDLGLLWEHFVLNEIAGHLQTKRFFYWRDKRNHELDFVFPQKAKIIAVECKWKADEFEPSAVKSFRHRYPKGDNFVVAYDVDRPFTRIYNGLKIEFLSLKDLINFLS